MTAYLVEFESSSRWAILAAPGDDGYPSRHVGTLASVKHARRVAETLQRIADREGPDVARECELVACAVGSPR
jgi:hypothetical protein